MKRSTPASRKEAPPTILSLFTGAGGLDLGLEAAGYEVRACVELDGASRETLKANRPNWPLITPGDILALTPQTILEQAGLRQGELSLLAGGPPCQPFSVSSHWSNGGPRGMADPRASTIGAFLEVLEFALPKMVLMENVDGLVRRLRGQASAAEQIIARLHQINLRHGTNYQATVFQRNAASFGVAQTRHRTFIVASRDGLSFAPPAPVFGPETGRPYRTTWDAIGDLDHRPSAQELLPKGKWADLLPSIPPGNNYLWHTSRGGGLPLFGWRTRYWSFLLKLSPTLPSWTVQASPGPAAGPFHWRNRLLSIEELCRLQTFPDGFKVSGDRHQAQRQIGNAVPSALAEAIAVEMRRQLLGHKIRIEIPSLAAAKASGPPPTGISQEMAPVPARYLTLAGHHPDHPGTGLGPGKRHDLWATPSMDEPNHESTVLQGTAR